MKTFPRLRLAALLLAVWLAGSGPGRADDAPVQTPPGAPALAPATDTAAPAAAPAADNAAPAAAPVLPAPVPLPPVPAANPELRLNFRGVPVDTVLDYLSKAGGFVIVRDAAVSGTVDVWSQQPLNRDEAVALLHSILNDRGYAVIRNDRVLRIVRRDDARSQDLPIQSGSDPAAVPKTAEIVTQIIPIRHTAAAKLMDNLRPLLPAGALLTANEDSNSLLITDTRTNIRRMMEIILALDTAVSSILDIKVYQLRYAKAEDTANVINKVFESPSKTTTGTSNQSGGRNMFGPPRMQGGDTQTAANNEAKQVATYVKAVADTRGNAVVVTAPAAVLSQIQELVTQLDVATEATTVLAVFPLRYADATEVANSLATLYGTSTTSTGTGSQNNRQGFFQRVFGQNQPGQSGQQQTTDSSRLAEAKVVAVADTRINAVIVTASSSTLTNIKEVLAQLDRTPANVPRVYTYTLENADLGDVQTLLEGMFSELDSTSSTSTRSSGTSSGSSSTNRSSSSGSSSSSSTNRSGSSSSSNF